MHYWKCPACGHQPPTARWATAQQYAPALQPILDTLKLIPVLSSPISFDVHPGFSNPSPLSLRCQKKLSPNTFLKELPNLKAALALHFAYYNFCRVHSTLRVTPAMAADIANEVWPLQKLLLEN